MSNFWGAVHFWTTTISQLFLGIEIKIKIRNTVSEKTAVNSIILQFAACDRLWEKSDITLCQIYHYFCTLKV